MSLVNNLADNFLNWQHRVNPFIASQRGVYSNQNEVPLYNTSYFCNQIVTIKQFQNDLHNIMIDELSVHEQVNYRLIDITFRQHLRQLEVIKYHQIDPAYVTSQVVGIAYLMLSREYSDINSRLNSLILRLEKCPEIIIEHRSLIKNPPIEFTNQAISQCNFGIKFLKNNLPEMVEGQGGTLSKQQLSIINKVIDCFKSQISFVESLKPVSNGKFAVGKEVFDDMLQNDYLMTYDTTSLIEKGWELLNDTKAQMRELAKEINPNSSWQDIIEEMKEHHPTEDKVLEAYRHESEKVKKFVIENNIADLPSNEELILVHTPSHMRGLFPYAGYCGPAVFDEFQSGRFWVTPVEPEWTKEQKEQKLKEHMYYKLPVFVLHEGYPGHHLQISTQHNLSENIRKIMHNNLFVEGWAFYCEELLENLGYISEPKTRLSRLKDQLWRACRIIIDASLHSEKMTFDEAVNLLINEAHLEKINAFAEVSRYIKNPLRPMSYLMGKLELLDIAREYKKLKGNEFTLKEFHNSLLQLGAIPPALVRKELFS